MNRKELQVLANLRVQEARVLLRGQQFSGAYYLAGYAVECALKACIAKRYRRHDFPDKKAVNDSYTHDLRKLASLAEIDKPILERSRDDAVFRKNWDLITLWSEESRYRAIDPATCRSFLNAIMEDEHGLIPWIKQRW